MRRSHLLLAGLGLGVVAVTGSAFTAENPFTNGNDQFVTGYGQAEISGATVTEIDLVPVGADGTFLDTVVFTTSTQLDTAVGGNIATLTIKDANGPLGSPYACNIAAWAASAHVITCDATDDPAFEDVAAVGLTVRD